MKQIIIIIFALLNVLDLLATAQQPDKLLYRGKEYMLHSNPLEVFFANNPNKRPKGGTVSTALWRGYVATFEIRDSILYVKDIEINDFGTNNKKSIKTDQAIEINDNTKDTSILLIDIEPMDENDNYEDRLKSVFNQVFPDQKEVMVNWLNGILVLPFGDLKKYVHMGYASTYENYILLEIELGKLKKEVYLDGDEYEEFKEKQFRAFKKTEEYKKLKSEMKKDGNSNEFIDSFLKNFVIQYSSKILTE